MSRSHVSDGWEFRKDHRHKEQQIVVNFSGEVDFSWLNVASFMLFNIDEWRLSLLASFFTFRTSPISIPSAMPER